jgi:hypothetical protein
MSNLYELKISTVYRFQLRKMGILLQNFESIIPFIAQESSGDDYTEN